jgi:hypothetical protein
VPVIAPVSVNWSRSPELKPLSTSSSEMLGDTGTPAPPSK